MEVEWAPQAFSAMGFQHTLSKQNRDLPHCPPSLKLASEESSISISEHQLPLRASHSHPAWSQIPPLPENSHMFEI